MRHVEVGRNVLDIEGRSILGLRDSLGLEFSQAVDFILASVGRVIVSGVGKSGHIGRKIFATFVSTGTPSLFLHPTEGLHGDLGAILPNDVILFISNSGETEEILQLLPYVEDNGNCVISITGNPKSTLAKFSRYHLCAAVPAEACPHQLAPTASTTAALAMGDALAVALMKARNFQPEDFARFHPGGSLGRKLLTQVGSMAKKVLMVAPTASVREVISKLAESTTGVICVGERNALVGIITDGDLRRSLNFSSEQAFFSLQASDLMTKSPKVIDAAARCAHADQMMAEWGVHSLVVLNSQGDVDGIYIPDMH